MYDPLLEVVQKATLRTGHDGKSEKMGELGVGDVLICHRKKEGKKKDSLSQLQVCALTMHGYACAIAGGAGYARHALGA